MWTRTNGSDWMCFRDDKGNIVMRVHEHLDSIGIMPDEEDAKLIACAGMIPELVELLREFVNYNSADWVMKRSKKVLTQIEEALK